MELYQVRYFLAVADCLNFTRAAERCYVSQPALTKAIQKLEDTLGGQLFERAKSGVQLSEFGHAMLPNLQQVYTTALQARDQARRFHHNVQETLRVGIMCSIDFALVFPAFVDFQRLNPQVAMQFGEGSLEELSDRLDRNELELALVASPWPFARRFGGPALFSEDYVIAHPAGHRYAGRAQIPLSELRSEPYCDRTQCEFGVYIDQVMEAQGLDVNVVQQTPREDWVQTMVRSGVGVSFMPESTAHHAVLPFVKINGSPFRREVRALSLADRARNDSLRDLATHLQHRDWSTAAAWLHPTTQG